MSYRDKLNKIGSRKLLACDGGGIRGFISIEILAGIESELRKSSGNSRLVLADYFDYVAGTSTGAIIATLIALGHSAGEIRDFYLRSGPEMFHKARLWERFRTKFESDKLSEMLRDVIGEDTTLGATPMDWCDTSTPANHRSMNLRRITPHLRRRDWATVRIRGLYSQRFLSAIRPDNGNRRNRFLFVDNSDRAQASIPFHGSG